QSRPRRSKIRGQIFDSHMGQIIVMHKATTARARIEACIRKGAIPMKRLTVIVAAFILVLGAVASRAANVERISTATGVPITTLQTERASTGLGWGSLEKAHLLANATGQSFDNVVVLHQSGQGWGK